MNKHEGGNVHARNNQINPKADLGKSEFEEEKHKELKASFPGQKHWASEIFLSGCGAQWL